MCISVAYRADMLKSPKLLKISWISNPTGPETGPARRGLRTPCARNVLLEAHRKDYQKIRPIATVG